MPRFSNQQQRRFIAESIGKTIREVTWLPDQPEEPGYWVLHFTDDSELSVRLMAEIVGTPPLEIPYPWHCTLCGLKGETLVSNELSIEEGVRTIVASHGRVNPQCPGDMSTVRLGHPPLDR